MTSSSRRHPAQQEEDAELRLYKEFKADLEFLAAEYDELISRHPDHWVAIHDRKLVATAGKLDELVGCLRSLGLAHSSPVVQFLNTTPRVL